MGSKVEEALAVAEAIRGAIGTVIEGKPDVVELALVSLLAEGHLLIEDVPGVGKTCLLYTSPSPRDRTRSRMPSSA